MIKFENITYRYADNSQPALLNVSLEVSAGESVCVMGANGSGKSTFAKLTADLLKTQQGRLTVSVGENATIPVGLLFQNPDNQMVAVTVEKEIAFALENLGVSQREMEIRIQSILRNVSIEHLQERLTSELSVGEKQRVALAALLVCYPPVLVLDEPDSFLDNEGRNLFRHLMQEIKEQTPAITIIEITQYPQVAKDYERLIVFQNGRVAADGNSGTILQNKSFCLKCGIDFDHSSNKQIEVPQRPIAENSKALPSIASIVCDRVSFGYPGSNGYVFHNFSGEFKSYEITAVVGPSGSGKSTLGMLICGIHAPDSGTITWPDESKCVLDIKSIRGRITAALQQPERQFFLQTCEQEVEFAPKNFGRTISRKIVQGLFKMAGLPFEQFFERDPFTLSLGEKRRLAFASVLSMFPDFIVFDEPTCALDREGVGRFILLAGVLKNAGVGVILISHDEEIVKLLADKVIAFDGKGNFWSLNREKFLEKESRNPSAVAQ